MNRFDDFMPFVMKAECDYPNDPTGQYSNDPQDPGGETRWGCDKRSHPLVDIASLTYEGALDIYQLEWNSDGIEAMNQPLGEAHFDACVNCGVSRAQKFLSACGGSASSYIDQREAFYRRLVAYWQSIGKPDPAKFLDGWLNRTGDLRKFLDVQ